MKKAIQECRVVLLLLPIHFGRQKHGDQKNFEDGVHPTTKLTTTIPICE
jgi:hypothetical protein